MIKTRHTQHIIGHFRNDFYRPCDPTKRVLKEATWSSRLGFYRTVTTILQYKCNATEQASTNVLSAEAYI